MSGASRTQVGGPAAQVTSAAAPTSATAEPKPASTAAATRARFAVDRRFAEIAVLGVMVVWAANFIVVKDAITTLPPVGFTFLRYGLASIGLLTILRWSEGSIRRPTPDTMRILVLGGLGFGLYQILWTTGLQSIPAGDSALLIASTPVLVAVLAVISGADTFTPLKFAGAVLSFLGVVVVIAAGVGISLSGSAVGSVLTIAAATCWASYTAFAAPVLRTHSPLMLTTWATIGGTIVLFPFGMVQLLGPGGVAHVAEGRALPVVLAIAYSGLLAAAIANVIVFNGVRLLGPTRVITLQSFVPPMAVVLAYLFLAEPIRPAQVIGGVIIVAGVALTRVAYARPAPAARRTR